MSRIDAYRADGVSYWLDDTRFARPGGASLAPGLVDPTGLDMYGSPSFPGTYLPPISMNAQGPSVDPAHLTEALWSMPSCCGRDLGMMTDGGHTISPGEDWMTPALAQLLGLDGLDRTELEARVREQFGQLGQSGLPLEARPDSGLAEDIATGDLSELSRDDLIGLLSILAQYLSNRDHPESVAQNPQAALAPQGSWHPNGSGNLYGGGTETSGLNASAAGPSGPAPTGAAPTGTPGGESLAASAERVAKEMGSTGYCYRGVKQAVRAATGVELTGGSAYMAADQLSSSGQFSEVSVSPDELGSLPPGAVVVWGKTDKSPHGHISVALGDGREASDHVQQQMTSLRGHQNYRVFVPAG